jgi:hypothetical protein
MFLNETGSEAICFTSIETKQKLRLQKKEREKMAIHIHLTCSRHSNIVSRLEMETLHFLENKQIQILTRRPFFKVSSGSN